MPSCRPASGGHSAVEPTATPPTQPGSLYIVYLLQYNTYIIISLLSICQQCITARNTDLHAHAHVHTHTHTTDHLLCQRWSCHRSSQSCHIPPLTERSTHHITTHVTKPPTFIISLARASRAVSSHSLPWQRENMKWASYLGGGGDVGLLHKILAGSE